MPTLGAKPAIIFAFTPQLEQNMLLRPNKMAGGLNCTHDAFRESSIQSLATLTASVFERDYLVERNENVWGEVNYSEGKIIKFGVKF